ncbi:MAG: DNA-directed RNA polymerase subunit beta [Coriobacteriales bacterium]|nr:DNA-directed RNA polymerase subunit beta [Coriobacteriales bacterium]
MAKGKVSTPAALYRERKNFAKIPEVMDVPNLISIQTSSFEWLVTGGLAEAFRDISPIENPGKNLIAEFGAHEFGEPKHSEDECKKKDISYQASLIVEVKFTNKDTGEIKEQLVFMGDFPLMTKRGTFIINGTERIVVSQLVRSPGVYFGSEQDKTSDKVLYNCKVIPSRGAWLEFETDRRDFLSVKVDRKRKQPATLLLKALGIARNNDEVVALLGDSELVRRTLEKDGTDNREDALIEIYKRLRPGEPANVDSAATLLEGLFFNPQRYDLARVGRYKIDKKLGLSYSSGVDATRAATNGDYVCTVAENMGKTQERGAHNYSETGPSILTRDDIIQTMRYIVEQANGNPNCQLDDIDHFGNRRIKTVGELIQNQFRIGLSRMERVVRERMSTMEVEEITPTSLINIRPIVAAIKEFFGSSQLSQFMDQTNPATGITHKRRLSALGPGGLSRERAGFEVRDVHPSHYGRMCPIETPEGPNIGLIGSLATYARVNSYGFIEAPYRRVIESRVTDDIDYLTADEEENYVIAQANETFDQESRQFGRRDEKGRFIKATKVLCRTRGTDGEFGEPDEVAPERVQYMDVSPRQMVSVATALIPFLEHDDANRALMGSNMQRQAVPLLRPEAPLVGTGMEHRCAVDSGEIVLAEESGTVEYVQTNRVVVHGKSGTREYELPKFQRSNQSGCLNHKPLVRAGQKIEAGEVLADGPATSKGELSLGQNLLVAYMPWEGFNYEDAIILSERIVTDDLLTSIHISEYEIDARDTKLGPEEVTREIPNISDDMLGNLDMGGIIRIGAEVFPGDILVGKVTPKGETELTAEERLLRAIFGEKARDVRDTSLKIPHGAGGRIIDIQTFSRDAGDELSPGVNELVRVYVAQKRKIQQGDKLAGRHGNKGVISAILPIEDMPYLADGTPIDIILNPLGVPSRMNVGQLLETHLGWAAQHGWSDEDSDEAVFGPIHVASPVFDGASEEEISNAIERANKNLTLRVHEELGELARDEFIPQLSREGKTWLYDGRTGEKFREPVTVGQNYILKLSHLVDDKIHARSTGPYSLITQQPLGGKSQFGGQRFGEMEVWALYAYGASAVLEEIMTIKSDDTAGRVKAYEHIVKGENIPAPEVPESFKVLVKEMKSLCLDVELIGGQREETLEEFELEDTKDLSSVFEDGMFGEAGSDEDALDLIASGLDELTSGEIGDLLGLDALDALDSLGGTGQDSEDRDTDGIFAADTGSLDSDSEVDLDALLNENEPNSEGKE